MNQILKRSFSAKAAIGAAVLGTLALQGCASTRVPETPLQEVFASAIAKPATCQRLVPVTEAAQERYGFYRDQIFYRIMSGADASFGIKEDKIVNMELRRGTPFLTMFETYLSIAHLRQAYEECWGKYPACKPPDMIKMSDIQALCQKTTTPGIKQ